jgi:hypothetical protein
MKHLAYKRLGYHKGNNTYRLTVPPAVVESNEWEPGQVLYLRNRKGVFTYTDKPDELAFMSRDLPE